MARVEMDDDASREAVDGRCFHRGGAVRVRRRV
jgi:hypothetical protein